MLDLTFQMNSSSANMLKVCMCVMVQVLHKGKQGKTELSVQFQCWFLLQLKVKNVLVVYDV